MARLAEKGITLVEVLVAMGLLATAVVGLAAAYPAALVSLTISAHRTAAVLLAQRVVEVAAATPYAELPALASGFVTVPDDARFTRAVRVEPGAPTPGTTTVTVLVRSATGTGARETALATILAE